ncbi:MAG: hypothetical protein AAF682_02960 [Planctomycetota bacterium]
MLRKLLFALAGSLFFLPLASSDESPCGKCGDYQSIGGQTFLLGAFATAAQADAAANNSAAHEAAVMSALDAGGQAGCFEVICLPGPGTGCAPFFQTEDFEYEVSTTQGPAGFLVYVTVTGPDPRYRLCCEPDCPY